MSGELIIREMHGRLVALRDAGIRLHAQRQAREVLEGPLPGALGRAFGAADLAADPGTVVLDEVALDLSLAWEEPVEETARRWARAIVGRIRKGVRNAALRFEDPGEHLAFYLLETLAGRRDGRAALRPFMGFAAMPAGMAIRAALMREPALGWEALARITPAAAGALADTLTPDDARLLLPALAGAAATSGRVAISLAPPAVARAARGRSDAGAGLLLLLAGRDRAGHRRHDLAPEHLTLLGRALRYVVQWPSTARSTLLLGGFSGVGADADHVAAGAFAAAISVVPRNARAALAAALADPALHDSAHSIETWWSERAGFAMLAPVLAELTGAIPAPPDAPAAARLRLDILTAAAGMAEPTDPVLHLLAGFRPDARLPDPDAALAITLDATLRHRAARANPGGGSPAFSEEHEAVVTRIAGALLRRFAAELPGFETASRDFLTTQFLTTAGRAEVLDRSLSIHFRPAPLDAVLGFAGVNRGRLTPPWGLFSRIEFAPEAAP